MRHLFVGTLLLVTGLVAGYLLGRSETDPEPVDAVVERIEHIAEPDDTPSDSKLANVGRPASGERSSAPATAGAEHSTDLDRFDRTLLALADRLEPMPGELVLEGRVVDENGAPIAGATVTTSGPLISFQVNPIVVDPMTIGRAHDASPKLDPSVRRFVERSLRSIRPSGSTVTDDDGGFRVEELAAGLHTVRVHAEGFVFPQSSATPGDTIEVVGQAVRTFELDVMRPDGSRPDEATIVVLQDGRSGTRYAWSASAREIRVPSSRVSLVAATGDVIVLNGGDVRADERSSPHTFDAETDGRGPHLLELVACPSVRVNVTAAPDAGQPFDPWCRLVRDSL